MPNAVLCSSGSINASRLVYRQKADFWDMPVKASPRLRAKWRFLGYARKSQLPVTGKMSIFEICP
ncbi:hypothetical protein E4M16_07705 [Ligilactobacillus ruminis]|nr:hypothetical protein E4M16_07705 [Ligilactobacillus ruminis]